MSRPSDSVVVLLGVGMVAAASFGAFNYSRYRDARGVAETHESLRDAEADAALRARDAEARAALRDRETLAAEVDKLRAELAAARRVNDEVAAAHGAVRDGLKNLTKAATGINEQAAALQTSRDTALNELDAIRRRNGQLEEERLRLVADRERSEAARLAAEADNKQLRDRYEGKSKPSTLVAAEARGTVTGLDPAGGDTLTLSVGRDVGLTRGAELDVYRPGGRGVLLGTAVVVDTGAKSATARFKAAGGRAFGELKADERPKVGDLVSGVSAGRSGDR